MKRLIVSLVVSCMLLVLSPASIRAEDETNCVQVTQYGGGVGIVCGAKHEPVGTGLADIHPVALASIFFLGAGYTLYKAKKLESVEVGL